MSKKKSQRLLRKTDNKMSKKKASEPDKAPPNLSFFGFVAGLIGWVLKFIWQCVCVVVGLIVFLISNAFTILLVLGLLLRVLKPILILAIAFYRSHWSWKVTLILIPTILILLFFWSDSSDDDNSLSANGSI